MSPALSNELNTVKVEQAAATNPPPPSSKIYEENVPDPSASIPDPSASSPDPSASVPKGDARDKMKKNITLTRGIALVVGTIIGTGIFITPNSISASVKSPVASILVWLAGGCVAAIGGLTFCELGTMIPLSGREVTFLRHIYGPLPSFLAMWMGFLLSGLTRAISVLGFSRYFWSMIYESEGDVPWYLDKAVCLVVLMSMVLLIAFKPTFSLQLAVLWTTLKLAATIIIIIAGLVYLCKGNYQNIDDGFEGTNTNLRDWGDAWNGVIWSYLGWEDICLVTSEVQNPQRNIPIIVGVSVTIVTIIYMLVVTSFHIVLPQAVMADSSIAVASEFGTTTMGEAGRMLLALAVVASMLGSLNITLLTQSRYIHSGAVEGLLPRVFSLVSIKYKTPMATIFFIGGFTSIFVLIGDVEDLIGSASFTLFPFYVMCSAGVFVMRKTHPDLDRPYRVPLIFPALFIVFGVYVFITPFLAADWLKSLMWVVVVLLGIPAYFLLVADVFNIKIIGKSMEILHRFVGNILRSD